MLDKEETEIVLNAWGADIVKFAQINLGDRNRTRKSKITGKTRRGKIDSSGDLRKSFNYDLEVFQNSFGFVVNSLDYASDIDTGARRKTSVSQIKKWMKQKPVRLTSSKGFIKMTPSKIDNFAKFVAWKVSKIGSDATWFLTDAVKRASKKHEEDLTDALFKDLGQAYSFILKGNGNNDN